LVQKQQLEIESSELDRAITELKKAGAGDAVYKSAGSVLIKANKDELLKEMEEKKELSSTRTTVLGKQETRVRENIKELQSKIEDALKGRTSAPAPSTSASSSAS